MIAIRLRPGRERSLLRRHPWIFSGAIQTVDGTPSAGETVDVLSAKGEFLARAAFSPNSQIRARIWTFIDEQVNPDFLARQIKAAVKRRQISNQLNGTDSFRLIYAESDSLPGIIVDRYGQTLVLQCLTCGAEYWRETVADILVDITGLNDIFERSDSDVRELEGLPQRQGSLRGNPQTDLTISENGIKFQVDLMQGHKTGFYLDQRSNRQRLRNYAKGRQVLDCFCYTGGFSLNALSGAAKSVLAVDASEEALMLLSKNVRINQFSGNNLETLNGDVFQRLRTFRDAAREFDLIILDPPKFAPTLTHVEKASRGYKDINLLAFKLLRPGGILFTFSCSGGVEAALFQKIVAGAALDAGVDVQILEHLSQAADHPVALNFPESSYLKGLICLRS